MKNKKLFIAVQIALFTVAVGNVSVILAQTTLSSEQTAMTSTGGTTSTLPPSGMTGTPPPSGMTGTPPPSGMTGTPPPSGMTGTPPPSGMTGTPPPSGMTGAPPPSSMTGTPPPSGMTGTPPPSGMTGTPPPSGMTGTPPPTGTTGTSSSQPPGGAGSSGTSGTSTSSESAERKVSTPYSPPVESVSSTSTITNSAVSASLNAGGHTFEQQVTVEPTGRVVEGNFTVPVENHGVISRSTFNPVKTTAEEPSPSVTNHGSISQSTVKAPIENRGLISNSTLTANGSIHGGMVTGTMTNQGGIMADIEFVGIQLRGGTLEGTIANNSKVGGVIQDVQLAPQAILKGGKVGGTITAAPDSVLQNVRLVADTQIQGGILKGKIQGDPHHPAQLTDVEFASGTQLSHVTVIAPEGLPDDVTIGPGVTVLKALPLDAETTKKLENGDLNELPPATFQQLVSEQVEKIPARAFASLTATQLAQFNVDGLSALRSEQVANIPATAFSSLNAHQMGKLSTDAVTVMTKAQFGNLPKTALTGLTAPQMEALSTSVIHELTPEQLQVLPPAEIRQMSGQSFGKMLVHLDPDKVSPTDVTALLPDGWEVDTQTGAVIPPAHTPLTFQELPRSNKLPPQVTLPTMPDLNTSFGIGGVSDRTALERLNDTLPETDAIISVSQDQYGILHIQGGGDKTRQETSLITMLSSIQQVSPDSAVGLHRTEGGFIQVTNFDSQQFTLVPAPKDPADLSEVTNSECVMMGEQGDVLLSTASDSQSDMQVVIFDEAVKPAPTEVCEDTPEGTTTCNFELADPEQQPGIHDLEGNTRASSSLLQSKKVVYSDGTSQTVYPTVLSPQNFLQNALTLPGVEEVIFQTDGTFKMIQNGESHLVYHSFNSMTYTVAEDEEVVLGLVQNGHQLIYTVEVSCASIIDTSSTSEDAATRHKRSNESSGRARQVMEFESVMEPVSDSCEEIEGRTVCDSEESEAEEELTTTAE